METKVRVLEGLRGTAVSMAMHLSELWVTYTRLLEGHDVTIAFLLSSGIRGGGP